MQQTSLVQQQERGTRLAFRQHLGEFVADAFVADLTDLRRQVLDCPKSRRFDNVVETRRKTHCAQHAELVFGETPFGLADGANDPGFQIFSSFDKVQHLVADGIEQQAIDGEIAALHVFARVATEANFVGMAAVAVAKVAAEGGHLDDICFAGVSHVCMVFVFLFCAGIAGNVAFN